MNATTQKVTIEISGMTCEGCARNVKQKLESIEGIDSANVQWELKHAEIVFHSDKTIVPKIVTTFNSSQKNYQASIEKIEARSFWRNRTNWKEASKNTLSCLIGCSMGDFGMLMYLQYFHPNFPVMQGMILAMIGGLCTSVIFETILLKIRNGFSILESLKTAFSMSFLSMLAMEFTENIVDYSLTGGAVPMHHHFYWTALVLSMIAGFLVPLPYNYYKLEKYGKACH